MQRISESNTDEGSATIFGALAISAFMVIFAFIAYVVLALAARHQSRTAADLAALAGALALSDGNVEPCAHVRRIAELNESVMVNCEITGDDVLVTVEKPIHLGRLGLRHATSSSRAGPED